MQGLRAVLTLSSVALTACAVEPEPETGTETFVGDTQETGHDFTCLGAPLPGTAAEQVDVRGYTNDAYGQVGLPGVAVDLFDKKGALLDATESDEGGVVELSLETAGTALDLYARMTRDGHVDSYLYPSRPLIDDAENVFFPVLPPSWREELAGFAGVELDPSAGIVAVIVTDCAGARVAGAQVSFDPPAARVAYWDPTFTDPSGDRTTLNGHAWGFNVPAGVVRATVTVDDITYRDWPVRSFADSRTVSWRAP
jgi:hypothetical protein